MSPVRIGTSEKTATAALSAGRFSVARLIRERGQGGKSVGRPAASKQAASLGWSLPGPSYLTIAEIAAPELLATLCDCATI
jgi:hypothetical protein